MELEFDPIADAACSGIPAAGAATNQQIEPGTTADYNTEGHLVSIEILSVPRPGLGRALGQVA
jgi:hypothetical protein